MRFLSRGPFLAHPSSGLRRRISWAGQVRGLNLQYGKGKFITYEAVGEHPH
jgi:hypothetical protein